MAFSMAHEARVLLDVVGIQIASRAEVNSTARYMYCVLGAGGNGGL